MALGQMLEGSACHNMLAARCTCAQCGQDMSALSYQRRVAHVKRCEPAIKQFPWSIAPRMHQGWESLLQNSTFDENYHPCAWRCGGSISFNKKLGRYLLLNDIAGAGSAKQRADSAGRNDSSNMADSTEDHSLPGLRLHQVADSGQGITGALYELCSPGRIFLVAHLGMRN